MTLLICAQSAINKDAVYQPIRQKVVNYCDIFCCIEQCQYLWYWLFVAVVSLKVSMLGWGKCCNQKWRNSGLIYLGIYIDETLSWHKHVQMTINKSCKGIGLLRTMHHFLQEKQLQDLYSSFIKSYTEMVTLLGEEQQKQT